MDSEIIRAVQKDKQTKNEKVLFFILKKFVTKLFLFLLDMVLSQGRPKMLAKYNKVWVKLIY